MLSSSTATDKPQPNVHGAHGGLEGGGGGGHNLWEIFMCGLGNLRLSPPPSIHNTAGLQWTI